MSPGALERQKPKRELKLLIFSDIFVFMETAEVKKKGKKEYTKWPCELISVRSLPPPSGNAAPVFLHALEVFGPWKRFIFNCVSPDALELWKQSFIQVIEARLKSEPSAIRKYFFSFGVAVIAAKFHFIFWSALRILLCSSRSHENRWIIRKPGNFTGWHFRVDQWKNLPWFMESWNGKCSKK